MTSFIKRTSFVFILLLISLSVDKVPASEPQAMFEAAEHVAMGDSIQIFFFKNDPGDHKHIFYFSNGLKLTYGDILAFGDYYGNYSAPISQGVTLLDRQQRFMDAFYSFQSQQAGLEAEQILKIILDEKQFIEKAMKNGEKEEDAYKKILNEVNRRANCVSGGGCSKKFWWLRPGRYTKLLSYNYDHFGQNALDSYQIGHDLAEEKAILAHQTYDLVLLEQAYAMNAFACHFLSDYFSSGHIRTPRIELPNKVTPRIVGDILADYMHDEENQYGLHVHNLKGDHWIMYGDKTYFSKKNKADKRIIHEALQISANQIFAAYLTGNKQSDEEVLAYVPISDEDSVQGNFDISPMFYWDSKTKKIFRRKDIANLYDRHWTHSWLGLTTLIELIRVKGLPSRIKAQLSQFELGKKLLEQEKNHV